MDLISKLMHSLNDRGLHGSACFLGVYRMSAPQGLVFLPLGDATGEVQVLVQLPLWRQVLENVGSESVVLVEGVVRERPERDKREVREM